MYDNAVITRRSLRTCIILVAALTAAIAISGCGNYQISRVNGVYSLFTMTKGVSKFSFEYNNTYEVLSTDLGSTYSDVFLNGPEIGEAKDVTQISVWMNRLKAGESGYKDSLERSLSALNERDFAILSRLPTVVVSESGEEVVYSYLKLRQDTDAARGIPPAPAVARWIMFTHNNMLWWLKVDSLESSRDSANADFEHVVQTLNISN
jgi:hypothetical protein